MSDIFGASARLVRRRLGHRRATSGMVGEDVWTPGTAGDALRYMDDPAQDGASLDYYADYCVGSVDVHYSSGIANLAFYAAVQGRHAPARQDEHVRCTGIGIEKAAPHLLQGQRGPLHGQHHLRARRRRTRSRPPQQLGYDAADRGRGDQRVEGRGRGRAGALRRPTPPMEKDVPSRASPARGRARCTTPSRCPRAPRT